MEKHLHKEPVSALRCDLYVSCKDKRLSTRKLGMVRPCAGVITKAALGLVIEKARLHWPVPLTIGAVLLYSHDIDHDEIMEGGSGQPRLVEVGLGDDCNVPEQLPLFKKLSRLLIVASERSRRRTKRRRVGRTGMRTTRRASQQT